MILELLAAFVHWLGIVAYGGVLLVFAVLLPLAGRLRGLEPWHVDRAFRATGPLSGLAVGAIFLGGFARLYLDEGAIRWGWSSVEDTLLLAKHAVFCALWVSYTVLEIWTLEPLRRLDGASGVTDPAAYLRARVPVVRQVAVNAALMVVLILLGAAQGS